MHISKRVSVPGDSLLSRHALVSRAWWGVGALGLSLVLGGCKQPGETTGTGGNAAPSGGSGNGTTPAASIGKAAPYSGSDILLGEYGSLTGSTATFGTSSDHAIQMATEEQNAKGGIISRQIRVEVADDASDTSQASTVVRKLINSSNVLAILGEVASSRSLAAAPICQAAGVPMLSPSSTNPSVTEKGDYIFRSCFIDTFQGGVMSKFAHDVLKAKKVAVITDSANDYSKGLRDVFTADWTKKGGQIVAEGASYGKEKNFRAVLTTVQAANPDVIFVPGYYTEVAALANQAREQGIKQPLIGCDGWDSPDLFKIGGKSVQDCYYSDHYSPDSKDPKVQEFVANYKKKYGEVPDALAACAYDAAYIMFDAIKRASKDGKTIPERAAIRDALAQTKDFKGVTGVITMDPQRNASKPATIVQVKGDSSVFVTSYTPQQVGS